MITAQHLDDGVSNLKLMDSSIQVPKHPQLRSTSNPDPDRWWLIIRVRVAKYTRSRKPHEEPLQARRVHHREFVGHGQPEERAPEFLATKADMLRQAAAQDERERLERGTGSEHVVEVAVLDAGVENDELPEVGEDASTVGEAAGVRELQESEVEAAELGAAEDVGGKGHVEGRRRVDEEEFLHALVSEESRPPGEFIAAVEEPEEAEGEAYGAERTGVGGEEVVHGGNGVAHSSDGEVRVVEDERRGAPGAAP